MDATGASSAAAQAADEFIYYRLNQALNFGGALEIKGRGGWQTTRAGYFKALNSSQIGGLVGVAG